MNKKLKPVNHSYSNTAQNDLPHNWRWWWRCPITTTQDIFIIDIRCDVLDNAEKSYLLWKFLPLCLEIFQQSSVCETHVKFLNITFGCFFYHHHMVSKQWILTVMLMCRDSKASLVPCDVKQITRCRKIYWFSWPIKLPRNEYEGRLGISEGWITLRKSAKCRLIL